MTASARRNPTLVAFPSANLICLLGGIINTSGYTPSTPDAYTFNTQNNTWATKAAPPFSKTWSYPVLYNGLLYFMGGYHNPSGSSSSETNVRTWNPVTDIWVAKCYNFDITNNNSYSDYTTDYGSPCFLYNNLIYLPHSNVPYNKTYKPEDDIVTNGTGMSDNKLITLVSQYPNPAVVQYLAALRTMSKIYDALGTTIMDGYYQTPYMYTYGSNKFAGGTNQYAYMAMPPFDIKCDQSPWSYQSYTKANILLY
jgi:hypothetical protein